ncbi:hypothetical protein CWE09_09510 [Aliidiomarina minuta]|uniref:DUF2796 domain-containing protein n=1 Tax=Aliidiomarina minuta TaxID=880057 RepID=A0A432W9S4_9GAMM|nr:DUF2796 domain-containing protein [Aliidiomarina minuta]RUO26907.1 hypothetical protein CWE09_09510 [Aliidiomarina minuta]
MRITYLAFFIGLMTLPAAQAIAHGEHSHSHSHSHNEEHDHSKDHTQQGSHVHGVAYLSIAMAEGEIQIELQAPASDIVGFEHKPDTQEQKDAIDSAIALLRQGEWLKLQQGTDCLLENANATSTQLQGSGHGDFFAELYFQCNSKTPEYFTVSFFEHFPSVERIDTQWLSDMNHGSQRLTPGNARLQFN